MPEPHALTQEPLPSSHSLPALPSSSTSQSAPGWLVLAGNVANKLFAWTMAGGLFALLLFRWHEMEKSERMLVLASILGLSVAADRLVDISKAAARVVAAWKGGKAE